MGWIGCVRCENFWSDFLAQTFAPVPPVSTEFRNSTKRSQMHQTCTKRTKTWVQGPMGEDWVHWLRKIVTRLRTTNFCTSSASFAPSFVSQPNYPKCTKIVWNAPKHEFRVQWGGTGASVTKNFDATSWHELLHQFGPFCTEFRKSTKRSKMHQIFYEMHQNMSLGSNGVERVCSLQKIPMPLRGTNFYTSSARFASVL